MGKNHRADQVYERLRDAIVNGELKPGERLVEEEIAAQTRVSRTPVRAALLRLEVDGLIQNSGRGLSVAEFTPGELEDLCVVREHLEALAASLAARNASELTSGVLRELHSRYCEAAGSGDITAVVRLNHKFHEATWQMAHNSSLTETLLRYRSLIERLQSTTLGDSSRRQTSIVEHEAIIEAICNGNESLAAEVARNHFRKAMTIRLAAASAASSYGA